MNELPPPDADQLDPPAPSRLDRIVSWLARTPRWLIVSGMIVMVVGLVGSIVRVPVKSIGAGPTRDVLASLSIIGTPTYPSEGELLLTTAFVSDRTLNVWEALWVWLDPSLDTIDPGVLNPERLPDPEFDAENVRDMEASKIAAEIAAFRELGCDPVRVRGVRVLSVVAGSPADGSVEIGDRIVSVGGTRTDSFDDLSAVLRRVRPGADIRLGLVRGGKSISVSVVAAPPRDGGKGASLGVFLGDAVRLPHEVTIDTARIVGPSGGLVFALSLIEALTEEDLTRGRIVAVTGTIGSDGAVGTIGGLRQKVRGARAAGATVFIVPQAEEAEARRLAPPELTIAGVATLQDAVVALRGSTGALPALCGRG